MSGVMMEIEEGEAETGCDWPVSWWRLFALEKAWFV